MTETFIAEYFEAAATKVIAIGHTTEEPTFYRIRSKYNLDEFDNAVRNMVKSTALLLELGDGTLGSWDTPTDTARIGLHVLIKTDDTTFDAINSARDAAKAIIIQLIALMRHDCEPEGIYNDTQDGPLKAINLVFDSKGKYADIDGIDGNWYGKCVYFDWMAPDDFSYNPDNYTA